MGLPSVWQPPLPLQSFLPLVSPQPPLPLQEFWPLQACLSFLLLLAFLPLSAVELLSLSPPVWANAVWPATNPVRAAPMSSKRTDFVICESPFLIGDLAGASRQKTAVAVPPRPANFFWSTHSDTSWIGAC